MTAPITALGQGAARSVASIGGLARFSVRALASIHRLPRAGRRVAMRVMLRQIWFTALQAVPLVIVLAAILSFLVIRQATRELGSIGVSDAIVRVMVVAIVRELGPLLTALAVAGRSGTAIASELSTNKVMGEIDALEGMGIDPLHYHVLPRFGAAVLSVFGLVVFFDLVAVFAGLAASTSEGMASARYFELVLASLTFRDVWLTAAKGVLFGCVLGIVPSFWGLSIGGSPTEVPIATSRAVVSSYLLIFVLSGLFVMVST